MKYKLLGVLYLVQGMPYGLQSSLLPIYLRGVGLSFTHISLTKVLYLPWLLKVLWAPFVDQHWTKRTWLLLSMCGLGMTCLVCTALSPDENFLLLAIVLLLMNLLASVQDIAVDGLAVIILNRKELGYGNTIQVVGYKLGSVLAGGGFLTVMHIFGWSNLFLLLATVYFLATLYTLSAPDFMITANVFITKVKYKNKTLKRLEILKMMFLVPGTLWTLGFVLIYKLGEHGATSMFPLFLLDHGMSPAELGFWNGMVGMTSSIAGSTMGGVLLAQKRKLFNLLRISLMLRFLSLCYQTILLTVYTSELWYMTDASLSLLKKDFLSKTRSHVGHWHC
ncbi:major facilitator superfamily domain-containing protein 3 isoform X2 [Rhinatrema bivittatum]|uniref:major facilitator superfamily domain-containing protein 3 isoform X2 n=1 Tax=Rhinatrema bivittatum TaxID=194408 RepID=UPI00112BC372|nr:major facilitator superfamily domain-containing protein 3 isoform X2 [Rhinatrema bivittatum]